MTQAERNWETLKGHLEAEYSCDLVGTLAGLTEDCVFEIVPLGLTARGKAEVEKVYRARFRDFPDLHTEVTRKIIGDDCIVLEGISSATAKGSFFGLPASGQSVRLPIVIVIPFRDGKMLGERAYFDAYELRRQLGLLPAGAEKEKRP
jgi:steroid delta-isomerase-like uncharacterized protein